MSSKASAPLPPRMYQIALLVTKGWTDKEIGRELNISHRTVEKVVRRIKDRIGEPGGRTTLINALVSRGYVENLEVKVAALEEQQKELLRQAEIMRFALERIARRNNIEPAHEIAKEALAEACHSLSPGGTHTCQSG